MISLRTKQYAIGSLLFLTVGVAIAGFTYYQIHKEGAMLAAHMEVIGKTKVMQERYNELLAVLTQNKTEKEKLAGYLLTEGRTIHFLNEIETLAREMGLAFSTNSLEVTPLPTAGFETVDLQLQAEGRRSDIIAFLNILETLPYFSRINQLNLGAKKSAEGDIWVATIHLAVALDAYDK